MKITPHTFTSTEEYDVATEQFELVAGYKGMRYEVVRKESGSTVAELPFGLTQNCKALGNLFANAPKLLEVAEFLVEKNHIDEHAKFLLLNVLKEIRGE